MALVIHGRIVPLDRDDPGATFDGRVWIGDGGLIDAVTRGTAAAPAGFAAADKLDVGDALVLPGLIDAHNHLGYDALPLWAEPRQKTPFLHHNSWPTAKSYKADVSWPAWVVTHAEPEAFLAYVQARALVGGTTAAQGWPATNRPQELAVRNIDDEKAGTNDPNLVYTSALTKSALQLGEMAQAIARGAGFIYHCAEGQQRTIVAREFVDAANAGCLRKTFMAIHCNAIADADWARWASNQAGAVVWSPFSNLWLYGTTTRVDLARKQGISICLGSDWGPSGTKHVLGELKVAKLVSDARRLGLGAQDLVEMITCNPGDVLARCWKIPVGRLEKGGFGDVTVIGAGRSGSPWDRIVAATERQVKLVVVGGRARYGDAALMDDAGAASATKLAVLGAKRKLAIPDPAHPAKCCEWSDVIARLEDVRKDPAAALKRAEDRRRGHAGPVDAHDAPLELTLDMPGGLDAFAGPPPDPSAVEIPPLPSLVHDDAFFADVHGRGFHGGLLDGLAAFYR